MPVERSERREFDGVVVNSASATQVDNGWEFELGMVLGDSKIVVMLGKDDHSEMYNQFLPVLPREFALPNVTSAMST